MPIAQRTIGRPVFEIEDPRRADFMDNPDRIDALGEPGPGFVRRHADETGNAAGTRRCGDRRALPTRSVSLRGENPQAHALGTVRARFDIRKDQWFETLRGADVLVQPVAEGPVPTVDEASAHMGECRRTGPNDRVSGWDALPDATLWMEKRCA